MENNNNSNPAEVPQITKEELESVVNLLEVCKDESAALYELKQLIKKLS